jgi:hypothetical protein
MNMSGDFPNLQKVRSCAPNDYSTLDLFGISWQWRHY